MGTRTQDVTGGGWVGSDLRSYHLDGVDGVPYTQFRLGSTRRVVDRRTGEFRDGPTLWFTVKAWRATAANLASSLRKGEPVVVVGRLGQSEWVAQDGAARSELVLEAVAVGHDLTYGSGRFRRTVTGARTDGPAGAVAADDPWASDGDDERDAPDPTEDAPTEDGPTEDGPTEDGPTEDGPTSDERSTLLDEPATLLPARG